MKALVAGPILLALAVQVSIVFAEEGTPPPKMMSGAAILKGLSEKSDENLTNFITFLDYELDKSNLSDTEIDAVVVKLLLIQKADPYKKLVSRKGPPEEINPNRLVAGQCIFRFTFQKIANHLRKLPMKDRVSAIFQGLSHPPQIGYETAGSFSHELVVAGPEAVPFIIQHKSAKPYERRQVVYALAQIGDPRGIDYIIDVLQTPGDEFRFERPIAAKALGEFHGDKVVRALVEALKDETFETIDRHMPQQLPTAGHKPYFGRFYTVQLAAAKSLTAITKHDWGFLFNEDYQTWSAWLTAADKEGFNPHELKRSPEDCARLIRFLFHRYMSARPNPWQPQNTLESAAACRSLAQDLKSLGIDVKPLIRAECQARLAETPLWKDELTRWTEQLLNALD